MSPVMGNRTKDKRPKQVTGRRLPRWSCLVYVLIVVLIIASDRLLALDAALEQEIALMLPTESEQGTSSKAISKPKQIAKREMDVTKTVTVLEAKTKEPRIQQQRPLDSTGVNYAQNRKTLRQLDVKIKSLFH